MKKNILLAYILLYPIVFFAQFGTLQLIGDDFQTTKVHAADLDGDGDMDVLISGWNSDTIAWYENLDGFGNFGNINYVTNNLNSTQSLSTADFDGDGDLDILASSLGDNKVVWYKNLDGQGIFGTEIIINNNAPFVSKVVATDIDNDNDLDVVAAVTNASKVVWYENIDGLGLFIDEVIISNTTTGVYELDVADVNGDSYIDVLTNSSSIGKPSWFENLDGEGNFGSENIIDFDGTFKIVPADIDGDGDIDIFKRELVGEDNLFTWLENTDGLGSFIERQIISNFYQGRDMYATDIDNDGDIDLLTVYVGDGKIAWFENLDGLGTFGDRQIIDNFASISIVGADLDGDGYKDVLTLANNNPVWYKNLTYLGLNDDTINNQIKLYPNPTQNILYIENNSGYAISTLKVYDILGRLVLQTNKPTKQLDVSSLANGLLFVHMDTDGGVIIKKVLR